MKSEFNPISCEVIPPFSFTWASYLWMYYQNTHCVTCLFIVVVCALFLCLLSRRQSVLPPFEIGLGVICRRVVGDIGGPWGAQSGSINQVPATERRGLAQTLTDYYLWFFYQLARFCLSARPQLKIVYGGNWFGRGLPWQSLVLKERGDVLGQAFKQDVLLKAPTPVKVSSLLKL